MLTQIIENHTHTQKNNFLLISFFTVFWYIFYVVHQFVKIRSGELIKFSYWKFILDRYLLDY